MFFALIGFLSLINSEIVLESRSGSYAAGAQKSYDSVGRNLLSNQPVHHQNNYFTQSYGLGGNFQPLYIPYRPVMTYNPHQLFPQPIGFYNPPVLG